MRNFNNDNNSRRPQGSGRDFDRRGSGRSNFGGRDSGRSSFGSRDGGRNQMHDAVCADCGNDCKVPFMPSSGKPVYCSDCFENRGNGRSDSDRPGYSDRGRSSDRGSRRTNFPDRNKPLAVSRPQKDYSRQFEILNDKLDKLLDALTPKEEKAAKPKKAKAVKKEVVLESIVEEPTAETVVETVVETAPNSTAEEQAV